MESDESLIARTLNEELRAFHRLDRFKGTAPFGSWLLLRNNTYDWELSA